MSIDRKTTAGSSKQKQLQLELDDFLETSIIDELSKYDPKLKFDLVPILVRDKIFKQTTRQVFGLIWKSIRSPIHSRLVREGGQSSAFVEIVRTPSDWSRYDADLLLIEIREKKFLNGLALRDEFVRILKIIFQRDFLNGIPKDRRFRFELQDTDFTRNSIQLIFHFRPENDPNPVVLIVELLLLVEFDFPSIEFLDETTGRSICRHSSINQFFFEQNAGRTSRLTIFNSIKFVFDYSSTEAQLSQWIFDDDSPMSNVLKSFYKLRKEWTKYVQRAAKYATETIKIQSHNEKHRQSTCSVTSSRSNKSSSSANRQQNSTKVPLITEMESACEFIFSIPVLRLLFLCMCVQWEQFGNDPESGAAFAIEKALKFYSDALDKNQLEHPFFPGTNLLPDCYFTYEPGIRIGIKKLIQEMQRDWKRSVRR